MEFEEIKAGLEKYMAEIDEEKRNAARNLSAKYIVKEHSALINDGNDLFYVYAHYPTTEPDVMVMAFVSRANAELFCEALNAENERREADVFKHGVWIKISNGHEMNLIDRDNAVRALGSKAKQAYNKNNRLVYMIYKDAAELVDKLPTVESFNFIDPVKHGKWLHNSDRPD